MTSPNNSSRENLVSSPILRKHSQADQLIYGDDVRTRPRTGDAFNPQRLFKRSIWSRSPDPLFSTLSQPQPQYSPGPSAVTFANTMYQPQYSPALSFVVSPGSTPAPGKPLTELLLEHQPYLFELATRSPFLVAAGTGNLSKALLSRWLSQGRLYAQACIGFIGALISRVDLPYTYVEDKQSSLRWRIVNMLCSCLENIHRELKCFEDVVKRYDLKLDYPPRPDVYFTADSAAKQYIELFRAFWTDPTMTLLEGLVILWATEYCYLNAWRYAKSHLKPKSRDDLDGGALRNEFIPNWTSDEVEKFVNEIALCTNLLAERDDADGSKTATLEAVWAHILAIERKFWPEM